MRFLNLIGDIRKNKRQRHVTLPFLKIDMRHRDPPVWGVWGWGDRGVGGPGCPLRGGGVGRRGGR